MLYYTIYPLRQRDFTAGIRMASSPKKRTFVQVDDIQTDIALPPKKEGWQSSTPRLRTLVKRTVPVPVILK